MKQTTLLRHVIGLALAGLSEIRILGVVAPDKRRSAPRIAGGTRGINSTGPISRPNHGFKRNRRAELKRSARRANR